MELGHELATDGEPESVALNAAAFIASQTDKGLEDLLAPRVGNSEAGVGD